MNEKGKKGTTRGNILRWEAKLWSYLSRGDGSRCPLSDCCQTREQGGWCPDGNKGNINRLLDERRFNFHSYNFIESEAKGFCRLCQLVEMLAQKYLKMGGVCSLPVPNKLAMLFSQQHRVEIRQLPLKVYHGAIWHHDNDWIIQLKDSDVAATKRFTIFHESFHILAHSNQILAHSKTGPVFRKRGSVIGSFNELLADHFALCILMPREWVGERWAEVKDLDRIAEIFNVPKSAMCIRLRQLGLV